MTCDICKKGFGKAAPMIRWRSNWPAENISAVMVLHKDCDTHRWPADGYGHIDARALTKNFVDDLCWRAKTQGNETNKKLQMALAGYGQTQEPIDPVFDWPVVTLEEIEETPF